MKTINSFLKSLRQAPVYSDQFDSRESVFSNFAKEDDPDIQILYANYDTPCYEGYATVVYYRNSTKKYYEAYGSHCSCYGLEEQWDRDEEIVPEELFKRIGELEDLYESYLKS